MIASETQVWRDTEKLVSYLIDITMLFPKAYKFTIGQKITNVSLEIRRKCASIISDKWWKVMYFNGHFNKISIKNKFKLKNNEQLV